jgi:hypothetical protein
MSESGSGKIPTTSVRRRISRLRRSSGQIVAPDLLGERGEDVGAVAWDSLQARSGRLAGPVDRPVSHIEFEVPDAEGVQLAVEELERTGCNPAVCFHRRWIRRLSDEAGVA